MLTLDEAIQVLNSGTQVEVPYQTRKGCRGLTRRVETSDYWVSLSVSEKPQRAWLEKLIEEAIETEQ